MSTRNRSSHPLRAGIQGALLLLALTGAAGCGTIRYARPGGQLVQLSNGAWVVANQPYPVFYADGSYWLYDNGYWYGSSWLGGWSPVTIGLVPPSIVALRQPYRYRYYSGGPGVHVRTVPQAHYRGGRVVVAPPVRVRPGQPVVRVRPAPGRPAVVRPRGGPVYVRPRGRTQQGYWQDRGGRQGPRPSPGYGPRGGPRGGPGRGPGHVRPR